jgi:drug/metabolite transporter (DMT)-like permease
MGIKVQLLGHGLLTWCLRRLTPCFVAFGCLLKPILGSLWASLYVGEAVVLATLAGGFLVLLAIGIGARAEADNLPARGAPDHGRGLAAHPVGS